MRYFSLHFLKGRFGAKGNKSHFKCCHFLLLSLFSELKPGLSVLCVTVYVHTVCTRKGEGHSEQALV